jgi:hypothetical protein
MFREPLDIAIIVLTVAMAVVMTWLWFQIPDCTPDSTGHCAFYSSP